MLFDDTYHMPTNASEGIYKEKGSKFIAYTFHIKDEDDVKTRMAEVRKKEYSARHHCYAYVLNPDKSIQRDSDDGEPSNTAGKPILGQLLTVNIVKFVFDFGFDILTSLSRTFDLGFKGLNFLNKFDFFNLV